MLSCHYAKLMHLLLQGFSSVYKPEKRRNGALSFAELLHECAVACPEMRIRFTSPHPKDFSDDVLKVCIPCLDMPPACCDCWTRSVRALSFECMASVCRS